jgi:hypothetical protein
VTDAKIGLYSRSPNSFEKMVVCNKWRMRFNSNLPGYRAEFTGAGIWFGHDTSATDLRVLSQIKVKNVYFEGFCSETDAAGYDHWLAKIDGQKDGGDSRHKHLCIYIPRLGCVFAWFAPRHWRTPYLKQGDTIAFESLFNCEIRPKPPKWIVSVPS